MAARDFEQFGLWYSTVWVIGIEQILDESGEDFAQKEVVLTARVGRAVEKVRRFAKNCQADRCQMIAGALTLQTLFALVPGLTIAYLSLSTFEASLALSRSMENVIFSYVVPESVAKAQEYLRQFSDKAVLRSSPNFEHSKRGPAGHYGHFNAEHDRADLQSNLASHSAANRFAQVGGLHRPANPRATAVGLGIVDYDLCFFITVSF